jgi:hypothetical protein
MQSRFAVLSRTKICGDSGVRTGFIQQRRLEDTIDNMDFSTIIGKIGMAQCRIPPLRQNLIFMSDTRRDPG